MAAIDDLVSTVKGAVQNVGQIAQTLQNVFPRITGSFTLSAATTTVVTQTAVAANTVVLLTPTNATAALTVKNSGLYHSANTPGASFTVSTASGAASGTETFEYALVNTV